MHEMASARACALFWRSQSLPFTLSLESCARINASGRILHIIIATRQSERQDPIAAVSKLQEFVREQRSCLCANSPIDPSPGDGRSALDTARSCLGAVSKLNLLMEFEKLRSRVSVKRHHCPPLIGIANKDNAVPHSQGAKGLCLGKHTLNSVDYRALPDDCPGGSINCTYH